MSKKYDPGPGQVSFGKDLNPKMTERIIQADPKLRIKLCALFHLSKQKQTIDVLLHQELQKLKRIHEKRTTEIVKARNVTSLMAKQFHQVIFWPANCYGVNQEVVKSHGSLVLKDYQEWASLVTHDVNPSLPLAYPQIQNYWFTCLKNCQLLKYLYNTKDGDIAKSILTIDIMHEETKESKSFSLHFVLKEDQKFFTNSFISVTFYFLDSLNPYRQESNAEFKQKGKKEATTTNGIFLMLLQNINLEDALSKTSEAKDMCQRFGKNYEIAMIFKEELIPYSLEYFTNSRDPEIKREIQMEKEIEMINEKKAKAKTKAAAVLKQTDVEEYPEYMEDNECNQQ